MCLYMYIYVRKHLCVCVYVYRRMDAQSALLILIRMKQYRIIVYFHDSYDSLIESISIKYYRQLFKLITINDIARTLI